MRSSKGDDDEEERLAAYEQTAKSDSLKRRSGLEAEPGRNREAEPGYNRDQYTYVALWFDRMYFKPNLMSSVSGWMQTRSAHHISLAYLPFMSDSSMEFLRSSLTEVLGDWWATPPAERPLALLPSRKFIIGTHCEETSFDGSPDNRFIWSTQTTFNFETSDFKSECSADLRELLDEGRIRLVNDPESLAACIAKFGAGPESKKLMNDLCIEFHRRDHSRLAAAERLESACVRKYGPGAELRLIEGKVHAHAEISTLLHYIRETMIYKHGVYHLEPVNEVGLLDVRSWHVTPQTRGLQASRQRLEAPDFAEYVTCFVERGPVP